MDPISSFVLGRTAGKLLDRVSTEFRVRVIERWSRRRAEAFFGEFCAQIAAATSEITPEAFEYALSRIVDDEMCSEVLFDAYRRVTLARSRLLGPRIIAILTAELVLMRRVAVETEDAIFSAAETLADEELLAFSRFVKESQKSTPLDAESGALRIKWRADRFDSYFARTATVPTGPLNLNDELGSWAAKLWTLGIIKQDIQETQSQYYADPTRDRLADGTVREIEWSIEVSRDYLKLVELIERANARPEGTSHKPCY